MAAWLNVPETARLQRNRLRRFPFEIVTTLRVRRMQFRDAAMLRTQRSTSLKVHWLFWFAKSPAKVARRTVRG